MKKRCSLASSTASATVTIRNEETGVATVQVTIGEAQAWCQPIEDATPLDAWEERLSLLALQTQLARRFE